MTTPEKFPSANGICIALAFALCSGTVSLQNAHSAEPSAAEILAASRAAMSQPLKYRLATGGIESVVYQKMLPDGSMASLTDISSPVKKTSIVYGKKSYELYLDQRVAIDTQFRYQSLRSQATSISSMLGGKAAGDSKVVGTVQRDGKDCYEIESTLTSDVIAALAKVTASGVKNMMPTVPAKYRYVIDKSTHLMVEMQVISQDGSLLSKMEYKDVQPQPDLSDDFFLLPTGFEIKTPKSMPEYHSLVVELSPKRPAVPKEPPPRPSKLLPPMAAQPQPSNSAGKIQPQSMSTGRKTVLVVSSVALVVLSTVFVLRRVKKARTR